MNILQTIYMNFFTIGALIAFIMYLLAALFLLTIPKKTSATFHVGLTLLIMSFLCLGYFIAAFFYVESAAYHRWLTVASSLFAAIPAMQVFFHYPVLIKPKLARIIQIIQWVYNIAIVGYFIQATYGAPTVYHFDGHYWDFDRDKPSAFVAYFILLNVAAFIGVAIWRIIVTKTHERWVVLGILLSFMTITVIPGALNSLSREGAMDRGTFSTLFDLLTVLGTFSLVIIYINNTKDRTTFMAKIVGVSLVVALLILQAMSYFFINEREDSYDGVHREMTARVLLDKSRPEDMDYIVEFSKADRTFNILRGSWISSDFENLRAEFLNTALRDSIESLPDESFSENLKPLLKSAHSSFAGYAALLRKFDEEMPRSEKNRGRGIFEKIDGMKYTLLYRYNKIQKIPDSDFRNGLTVFLRGQGGSFAPFKSAMEYHLTLSKSEGTELKREILEFVSAVKPQGARHYRESENGRATAFMKVDGIAGKIYEAGYSYERYRAFIHPAGLKLTIMLACILVVVLVGFQFFFLGALISPLNALLEGVRRVNDNDLEARVPVKVEDEIGFISRSFNKMVRSILAARKKLQEYAETLEEKVKQRTAELQATLDQVQSLKTQQDGDYFLTSLLIRPFAMNRSTEGPVHVEFLVKQKKQFEFRKWREEIGGDICMADKINLKGKRHTVFVNADAMGKSIQGAGGALVLGAVFDAIIERTNLTTAMQDQYPERWLKNAFIELQKVFESFDGSMLVSLVIGLIDDETGLFYYLNAEHPWTILLRNGKATFLENELVFRKLGTQGMEGTIFVRTFQLEPDDVVIVGSDGKDDLLIGMDDSGERIINEDENLILRLVEKARGDLNEIYNALIDYGDLTDDLSLLRVGYREDQPQTVSISGNQNLRQLMTDAKHLAKAEDWKGAVAVLEKAYSADNHQPEVIRALVKAYFKNHEYEKAAVLADDYIFLRPGDIDYVYLASYCYKLAGKFENAIDLGERIRLRNPGLVKNLLNLSDLYLKTGNRERAEMLAKQALTHQPDEAKAKKLLSIMEQDGAHSTNGH